jgi:hypothetical protein
MTIEEGFRIETRRRIAALNGENPTTVSVLPRWHSDFPSYILDREKLAIKRLDEAKTKLAALNKNSPDELKVIEDIYVPMDDTVSLLTLEFLGRTGVIDSSERSIALNGIRQMRPEFDSIAPDARDKYLGFLGGVALDEVNRIDSEMEDFYGPYLFAEKTNTFKQFAGYTIQAALAESNNEAQASLRRTG